MHKAGKRLCDQYIHMQRTVRELWRGQPTERSVTHLQILLSLFQTKTLLKESLSSFFIFFYFLFEVLKMPFLVGKLRKDATVGSDQGAELDGLGALV